MIRSENRRKRPKFEKFPVKFPVSREFDPETGSPLTGSSVSYYVPDIAYIIVFLGSLFSREFAGFTGLVFKAIRGRDGCTRDFGCGRYENLFGAISWLIFSRAEQLTSGEAEVIGGGNTQNRRFGLSESRGAFAV